MDELVRCSVPVDLQYIEWKRAKRVDWMIEGKALICTIEAAWDEPFKGCDQRIFWIFNGKDAYLFQLHPISLQHIIEFFHIVSKYYLMYKKHSYLTLIIARTRQFDSFKVTIAKIVYNNKQLAYSSANISY